MSSSIDDLLAQLTLAEQVSLLAGSDTWHTMPVERLGIPAMRVTDGPVGARGTVFGGLASLNMPCSTALASTWDPALVYEVGEVLGDEARLKGARVLLAPTVNLHRTPVGGRNFECFSEDPFLTSRMAVAYVSGVQSRGVAACIKHFVGNDTEFERMSIDSRIDDRTLRELYLVPFEAAVKEASVLAVMTAYNRINGPWSADSPLIADVLRGEWGFDGLVMSDWFGLHSTVEGVVAGTDLEMPGPTRLRGQLLIDAVERGEVSPETIRERAHAVLTLLDRTGALTDGGPGEEQASTTESGRALSRRAAAAGMVLLRNGGGDHPPALPIATDGVRRVAVLGPNAAVAKIMGGGSAQVTPTSVSHPLEALTARFASRAVEVVHGAGCSILCTLEPIDVRLIADMSVDVFATPAEVVDPAAVPVASNPCGPFTLWMSDPTGRGDSELDFGARVSASFTPDVGGAWRLGVQAIGHAVLRIDDVVVADNGSAPPGGSFFGMGREQTTGEIDLEAGRTYRLVVDLANPSIGVGMSGLSIDAGAPVVGDLMEDAIDLAASADLSIIVVGTNHDWESEGWDRTTLDLPGRQDELITRVSQVSPRTVVVVNAGSPVAMPWLDEVDSVVMAWFAGQEMGEALADVLFGDVEPQGRLPVTFPRRIEDTPADEHHPGRNGQAQYREGRLIGYRWYDTIGRDPLFAFGHGLGYADIGITAARALDAFTVEVDLSNASARDGAQVVQVYAHRLGRDDLLRDEADQRLVGFARVEVAASSTDSVVVRLHPDSYREWTDAGWANWSGPVELRIGVSSRQVSARVEVSP